MDVWNIYEALWGCEFETNVQPYKDGCLTQIIIRLHWQIKFGKKSCCLKQYNLCLLNTLHFGHKCTGICKKQWKKEHNTGGLTHLEGLASSFQGQGTYCTLVSKCQLLDWVKIPTLHRLAINSNNEVVGHDCPLCPCWYACWLCVLPLLIVCVCACVCVCVVYVFANACSTRARKYSDKCTGLSGFET